AAHILLKTEKVAKDVIKQLEKGADFAELANKLSENKGLEDGDLGYFSRELMVPEFSEAAFAMKEGEISKTPVKTKFGYHVIKAGPRRLSEAPKFEDVEKELMQAQAAQTVEKTMKELRKKAKIVKTPVKFDSNGKVVSK
ncbi:MAG: peptidylprolyl isomerase, partial [Alphaproteobacteria bacterium]|nr:peptidylprolyl isomerase [Alphaproteobacteria bacterium]